MGSKSTVLSVIGAIAIVLGLIVTLINLLGFLKPDFKLRATGSYVNIAIPDLIFEEMMSYLRENLPYSSWGTDYFYSNSATTTNILSFRQTESVLEFNIENLGRKTARSIKLELPFSGLYSLSASDQVDQFTKIIPLGDFNPTNKIKVLVWAETNISQYEEEKTKVTYDGGWSSIRYPRLIGSIWSFFINNFFYLVAWVPLAAWLLLPKALKQKIDSFLNKKL